MVKNALDERILKYIQEKPVYFDTSNKWGRVSKYMPYVEALRIMEPTKCLIFDRLEWEGMFGKTTTGMNCAIKNAGMTPRIVKTDTQVLVGTNNNNIKYSKVAKEKK